MVAGDRARF